MLRAIAAVSLSGSALVARRGVQCGDTEFDYKPLLSYSIIMNDIDTKLVRSFLVVATEKSFSTAAERLGCSQSTMSVRIQTLEDQLGQRLFDRGRHNVRVTAAGQDLLSHARSLVDIHDRLIDRAAARRVSGRVRLGIEENHGIGLFSRLRQHLHDGYTAIQLDIVCQPFRVLAEETRRGQLDLAIVTSLEEIRPATLLSRPRLHWVASKEFVFDKAAPLAIACYPEGCSLRERGFAALKNRNIAWRIALCSPSAEVIRDAVRAGEAITVMTEGTVPGDLNVVVRPSLLPPLGKAWIQLLEKPGQPSSAELAVKQQVIDTYLGK